MREILFRGKVKYNMPPHQKAGEWVFGGCAIYEESACIYDQDSRYCFYVNPETVGQYTGLKDKNSKMIFEGDIVEDQFENIGAVRYSDHFRDLRIHFYKRRDDLVQLKEGGVRIFDWVFPRMSLEIIGNIHDSPELLDKEAVK